MKVKMKLFMVYEARSLSATEDLLAQIKALVEPSRFTAEVNIVEPKAQALPDSKTEVAKRA